MARSAKLRSLMMPTSQSPDLSRQLLERARQSARQGVDHAAVALLTRAVQFDPTPETYGELGDALSRIERPSAALSAHLFAVMLAPGAPEVYRRLGRLLREQNRLPEALALCREVQRLETLDASIPSTSTLVEIAHVLRAQGYYAEARRQYESALAMSPTDADAWRGLGDIHASCARWELAVEAFQRALDSTLARTSPATDIPSSAIPAGVGWGGDDVGHVDARIAALHVSIGQALFRLGKILTAVQAYRTALNSDPRNVDACRHLVLALELVGEAREAVGAWVALGIALESRGNFDEARIAFQQAVSRKPDCLKALLYLGRSHIALDQAREAVAPLERALKINPEFPLAHAELGRALYTIGDVERAWDELPWFSHPKGSEWRAFEQPRWDGTPLDGRSILVWADQELGDTIHFARYVPLLKTRGASSITLECQPRLISLMSTLAGVDRVIARGAPLPYVDLQTPLTLLPVLLRESCRSMRVPMPEAVPYLSACSTLVQRWADRLVRVDHRAIHGVGESLDLKIGLCWAGHPEGIAARTRFTSLASFAPLAGMRGVRFISLQMGPQSPEVLCPPRGLAVEHLQDDTCSVSDTAALMCNLDLVISADTMIPHLAGALGRPVWLVLPRPADWRWMREREDSPWYPTMRLFRQTRPGAWREVFERVRTALESSSSPARSRWISAPHTRSTSAGNHVNALASTIRTTFGSDVGKRE
jgi:tetratricopeptide (TPR) repeat protein